MKTQQQNVLMDWPLAVELAAFMANGVTSSDEEMLRAAEDFLARVGHGGATFGIEAVALPDGSEFSYLNAGDTYALTVVCIDGECVATTWGDVYEQAEQDYEDETETIRCGYCGHYTEHPDGVNWRDVVCESCGHNVAG